ncbi:MAG: hypothetical protein K5881_10385 [Saccharofermentans sp.]|nr:hypothetical protein [Saccharofermentans sp.]
MRFYEDLKAYYFSKNPETDAEERSLIIGQSREYIKESFGDVLRPEKTVGGSIKKYLPIALFVVVVALLIIFSINKMVPAILFTFGGLFILFGIAVFIPGQKSEQPELPNTSKMPRAIPGAAMIAFGLGVIVPAAAAPTFGYSKSMAAGGATWFVLGGLFFIVYSIIGFVRFSKASKNTVQGRCIGYIKMVDGGNSHDSNINIQRYYITGAPVFEYTINGVTYQAFQEDNMRTGKLTPDLGDIVELGIHPDDPYAVFYHRNTGAKIFAIALSILALAAGIFIFCMVPAINDNGGFVVNTMGGQTRLAKAKFDDKTIAKYITVDYTIEYVTVTGTHENNGMPAVDLSNGRGLILQEKDKDKYPVGTELYVVYPAEGSGSLNFRAEDWEYSGTHEVKGLP